jgi:hypothetical protein
MQQLARREEELYHIADPAEIAHRNAGLRQKQGADSGEFPPEQERLYSYDAEAVLHG